MHAGHVPTQGLTSRVTRQERYFLLSPMMKTLLRNGTSVLIRFSIGTGAIFSPPLVMMSSRYRNQKSVCSEIACHIERWSPYGSDIQQLTVIMPTFDPACDVKEAILVYLANVTRMEPAVIINSFHCLLLIVEITHEHVAPIIANLQKALLGQLLLLLLFVSYLSFLMLVWVVYLEVSTRDQGATTSSSPLSLGIYIECLGARTLTHS